MSGVSDLYDCASEFLGACEQAVAVSPGGPIARSYVSPGPPSINCPPELIVYVGGPGEADTRPTTPQLATGHRAGSPGGYGAVHLIRLVAVVVRCTPTLRDDGSFPDPAAEEAAAVETIGDVWAVWNVVRALYKAGLIFTNPDGSQRELWFEQAVPLATSGGAAGWSIGIRVSLYGFAPQVVVSP